MEIRLKRLLVLLASTGLGFGCGSDSGSSSVSNSSSANTVIPAAQPGVAPDSLPLTTIYAFNQSSASEAEWSDMIAKVNRQLNDQFNPVWGTHGQLAVGTGTPPENIPYIVMENRESGARGYTDGLHGYLAYGEFSKSIWKAECSHVVLNLLTPGKLAGQEVEPYNYHVEPDGSVREDAPFELCDFIFPSRAGYGGTYQSYKGRPAYDYLGILSYP